MHPEEEETQSSERRKKDLANQANTPELYL